MEFQEIEHRHGTGVFGREGGEEGAQGVCEWELDFFFVGIWWGFWCRREGWDWRGVGVEEGGVSLGVVGGPLVFDICCERPDSGCYRRDGYWERCGCSRKDGHDVKWRVVGGGIILKCRREV